jgi:threonine dehydrogenase-like Zn-dependent dehydrogenase
MSPFASTVLVGGGDRPRPGGYDVVLEAAGGTSSEAILSAVAAVAPLGHVVCLGVYVPRVAAALPVRRVLEKECTLRGSKAYRFGRDRDDFATALSLLAGDPSTFIPVISAVRPWPTGPDDVSRTSGLKVVFVRSPSDMPS